MSAVPPESNRPTVEELIGKLELLRAAILPDPKKRADPYWTDDHLALLASAHREDSEAVDDVRSDQYDDGFAEAKVARQAEYAQLQQSQQALREALQQARREYGAFGSLSGETLSQMEAALSASQVTETTVRAETRDELLTKLGPLKPVAEDLLRRMASSDPTEP